MNIYTLIAYIPLNPVYDFADKITIINYKCPKSVAEAWAVVEFDSLQSKIYRSCQIEILINGIGFKTHNLVDYCHCDDYTDAHAALLEDFRAIRDLKDSLVKKYIQEHTARQLAERKAKEEEKQKKIQEDEEKDLMEFKRLCEKFKDKIIN